jgi:GT2 family glycosyltransferase
MDNAPPVRSVLDRAGELLRPVRSPRYPEFKIMTEDRVLTILRESDRKNTVRGRETPVADEPASAGSGTSSRCKIDCLVISDSGGLFLNGWVDDRSSPLRQVRINGAKWSKSLDSQHLGRSRRVDVDNSLGVAEPRLSGLWALASLDPVPAHGDVCSVEIILSDGTSLSSEVRLERCSAYALRDQAAAFLKPLEPVDVQLPTDSAYIRQIVGRASVVRPVFPRHNLESVIIAGDGGVFIVGWMDDTVEELDQIRVKGDGWQIEFMADALARTCRDDVQSSLEISRRHPFGYWGFASTKGLNRGSAHCTVDVCMKNGAGQRLEVSARILDQIELRNLVLLYLGSCKYMGNPQLDSLACVAKSIGKNIVDLNLRITSGIVSQPYVERFGSRHGIRKGSIIVCLYGKPEYLFVQNALFADGSGIEDYEFVYISNSPELAERLLREARIVSLTYDLDLTLILLPGNAGFGAANNTAVKFAGTNRVLMVNPDVFPFDGDWAAKHTHIIEQLPPDQTRIFGAPLYYDDGSLMHGGMYFDADVGVSLEASSFKRQTFLRVEHYGKGAPPSTDRFLRSRPVPAVTGAFMSFDRGWFEKLGGFAEEYVFGHYEDADLCLKSIEGGTAPWIHDLKLWHLEGKGSTALPALDGASAVNRWLFNRRWAEKVIPDMLGKSPRHPLLEGPGIVASMQDADSAAGIQCERNSGKPLRSSRRVKPPDGDQTANQYKEIVFGGA